MVQSWWCAEPHSSGAGQERLRAVALAGIDHVQLAIPPATEEVARAYWLDILGLVEVPKPAALASRGGAHFETTDGKIRVHVGVEDAFTPALKAHPAFQVDELDDLAAQLSAAGYDVRWSDEIPGTRRFHTDDPFGNRLEFC